METKNQFSFEISLSVLNHLGRNLYRSFATVLGEAISNSWDAEAKNVWIYINKENNSFFIKDDGTGMSADDFQGKFLKIGYSRRRDGHVSPASGRPYIGRKGIGKLALLSCAERIHVISKVEGGKYIGGVIDNSDLDKAIVEDLTPEKCPLEEWNPSIFELYTKDHDKGTIIYFEGIKEGIRNSLQFLRKIIALYFRFSLLDTAFTIYIDDEAITHRCLDDLAKRTEFLWKINSLDDPYVRNLLKIFTERNEERQLDVEGSIKGFVASVGKPRDLKVITTDERVGVDLFVNGRLRERDILKHIPTARVVENYLYGQIHFNDLDDGVGDDRFTSSRESVVAEDPKYKELLESLRKDVINEVIEDWDNWRRKHHKRGDPENLNIPPKQRRAEELYDTVSEEYALPADSESRKKVDGWVNALRGDAAFNFPSYAECFISENLIREFVQEKKIKLSKTARDESDKWHKRERDKKRKANISIDIRRVKSKLVYLSMDYLAALVDRKRDRAKETSLCRDANEYGPMRDAVAHTALLTDEAKKKLTAVYENIKGRIRTLLTGEDSGT